MSRRLPLALSAIVLLAAVLRLAPLMDVATGGTAPPGIALRYPLLHVLLAPFTIPADWVNGGSRAELIGFLVWSLLGIIAVAAIRRRLLQPFGLLAALILFCLWLVYLPRPIPRLEAAGDSLLVFDAHSHTNRSRDGRRGFSIAANARWHQRAGFHAAFVTDHNVLSEARQWRLERPPGAVRLLDGEELSLRGLHVVVLGNNERINNEPWNDDWDSTLSLLARLSGRAGDAPYLIASLPEYWRHHWGTDVGRMIAAGIDGFEVWTTSPKAMEVPASVRREVVARSRLERLGLFGSTDMHGIGHTASVWNVIALPGWRDLPDSVLTARLIERFRAEPAASHVYAMRRWVPESGAGRLFAVPLGLLTALRSAPLRHAAALLLWIWLPSILVLLRARLRSP